MGEQFENSRSSDRTLDSRTLDSRGAALTKWLMIHSRPLIFGLFAVNMLVAYSLSPHEANEVDDKRLVVSAIPEEHTESVLVLLSDSPQLPVDDVTQPVIKECRVWGPQQQVSAFTDLSEILETTGGFPEIVELEVAAPPSYMVYVDVREGSAQARQVMQELTAIKIDNYRIARQDGDIVSVGVFSNRELAENQLQRILDLGYNTQLETIERNQTVFTLRGYVEKDSAPYMSSSHECDGQKGLQVSQY